ncbi:hypothetical protein [Moritella sp. F3]|uniref:hypothetical protein n=1 Tax=Moritella sp. F3 TaxID=2718882 RepID=UPI0018E187CC|nr:hypothetical protein [Moritella sp. F3]GIC77635.1 hypothetical protein FMO001_23620 [Moritella sp. F1]GIC82048.1 hypothetical protein FMO003_23290 [Moritella sp. F3]
MTNNTNLAKLIASGNRAFRKANNISSGDDFFDATVKLPTYNDRVLDVMFTFDSDNKEIPIIIVSYKSSEEVVDYEKSEVIKVTGIFGVSQCQQSLENAIQELECGGVESPKTFYAFFHFIGYVNEFMAQHTVLGFKSAAHQFNRKWRTNQMNDVFDNFDGASSDKMGLTWLRDFDSSLSKNLAGAKCDESLDLLIHLQDDFLGNLTGSNKPYENSTPPLLQRLVEVHGKDKTASILTNLILKL